MAPRAYWRGFLKLSPVSCPIALFPATSEREKISFHQLNKKTGHRIKYRKVDAESGDEVDSADIIPRRATDMEAPIWSITHQPIRPRSWPSLRIEQHRASRPPHTR